MAAGEYLDGDRDKGSPVFGYTPTIMGYEVIALDTGRSMGFQRETPREANGIAQSLNAAARVSPQALARALRG
jgi:hypothetical protein